jgi:hypothetical protein
MSNPPLPQTQQDLLIKLSPLISEYLSEVKLSTSLQDFLHELQVFPIVIEDQLIGFWAGIIRASGTAKLFTIKGFYVRKQYRGRYISKAADNLYYFAMRQGVTDVEIWNSPGVQKWFERRYAAKPLLYVTHAKIATFRPKGDSSQQNEPLK